MNEQQNRDDEALGFTAALEALEEILARIDRDEIDIDLLADELQQAKQLLELCRDKIKTAEIEVERIAAEIGDGDDADADAGAAP